MSPIDSFKEDKCCKYKLLYLILSLQILQGNFILIKNSLTEFHLTFDKNYLNQSKG